MKHLNLFENEALYEAFKSGSDFVLPNVSFVEDVRKLYYNPFVAEPSYVIQATYKSESWMDSLTIVKADDSVKSVKVNGVLLPKPQSNFYITEITGVEEYNVEIELNTSDIKKYLFSAADGLRTVVIPEGVTSICDNAFSNSEQSGKLTSVTLPNSLRSIGSHAFSFNYSLTSITIPEGVTSIGSYAFYDTSIKSITLPESITELENYALEDIRGLNEIICMGRIAPNNIENARTWWSCSGVFKYPAGADYSVVVNKIYAEPDILSWTAEEF